MTDEQKQVMAKWVNQYPDDECLTRTDIEFSYHAGFNAALPTDEKLREIAEHIDRFFIKVSGGIFSEEVFDYLKKELG